MNFKGLLRALKRKTTGRDSPVGPSRPNTPLPNNDQDVEHGRVPSFALSALVLNPFVPTPETSMHEQRPLGPTTTNHDAWSNLTSFSAILNRSYLFSPIAAVIDNLNWFIRAHENVITARAEYEALRTQLNGLFKDLCIHLSGDAPPIVTDSMLNLCEAIQTELQNIYGTQDRNVISRYLQADQAADDIMECYRRIQGLLGRLNLNANLSIWRAVDDLKTETLLKDISPVRSASYDSVEASSVRRRECTVKTREQVLMDLNTWKANLDGEKICWMSGMAGTGKTTIANTLCKSLNSSHELGASFFCTRLLPECRNVNFIMPTIAYELARFSRPFRSALSQALERNPDLHAKALRTQFERMILQPLRDVAHALPKNVVVVIDALDECSDNDGVERILQVLLEYASDLPIKFLVSSRPEPHIRERISRSDMKIQLTLHELEKKVVKADIETYLREELASVSPTESQISALVERAGCLFIYAATVVRYIKSGKSQSRLNTVLNAPNYGTNSPNSTKEIDGLYETVLMSGLNESDLEPLEKEQIELVLHTVICSQEPLTVDAIAGILRLSRADIQDALRPWWSILHISESDTTHKVSTLHASFSDYMLDSSRSKQFACNAEVHNGKLAELCFKRIEQNQPQFNVCDLTSSYVFDEDVRDLAERVDQAIPLDLLYACQYWAAHLYLG
ncbi:unnamed protein product [Rhizoctonia solani]|uniref:NACHT domain-containing protein n=1 Tax=Rhizoctonia solani TaxID=456999 RepID=A0A8H2ZZE2_9AGAM|nr:unnamed protein product [Rhizoctonia solani]